MKFFGWLIGFIIAIITLYQNKFNIEQNIRINHEQMDSNRKLVLLQLEKSKELTELSLKPLLNFQIVQNNKSSKNFSISNNGIGPAIISEIVIILNGRKISNNNGYINNFDELLSALSLKEYDINYGIEYINELSVGISIKPGQSVILFKTTDRIFDELLTKNLDNFLAHISISISYYPIYNIEQKFKVKYN
jgi:hypothetical protein